MEVGGFVRNNINQFAFVYRIVDIVLIHCTLAITAYAYLGSYSYRYLVLALLANISFSFIAESFSLYRSWRSGSTKEMFFYTSVSWLLSLFPVLFILFLLKESEDFSRVTLLVWTISTLILLCLWRLQFRRFLLSIREKGFNTRSVGIVSLTPRGISLAEQINRHPELGYRLRAVFDQRSPERLDSRYRDYHEGGIEEAVEMARSNQLDSLFVALPLSASDRIQYILKSLGDTTVDVHLLPDLFTYNLLHARIGTIGDVQSVSIYDSPMRGASSVIKRIEDLLLASAILTIIAIPMLVIAIIVKLSSPGPVLFKQDRYGLDGKKIKVWKFRSMRTMDNGEVVKQATKGDPRITPFGAFIRRTSLDELPQFFNVLQGTMSVVGPRPHAVSHNEQYRKQVDYYMLRHKMKPGITGWAQVNGWRGETDTIEKMEMRIRYDLDYIRNWSLWMDFKIVIFTLFKGFINKNAY